MAFGVRLVHFWATCLFAKSCNIEEEEEERRGGDSGRRRTHLTPPKVNTLDPPRLPLCQTARLRVLFRPCASLYGQFCACPHLEEGGGHSCAHTLGATTPPSHTGFSIRTPHFASCSPHQFGSNPRIKCNLIKIGE